MSLLDQVTPSPRKIMTLFYVVDTSGSMTGDKIGSVNSAMEEAITVDLPDISTANDDAEIRVAIMQLEMFWLRLQALLSLLSQLTTSIL